MEQAAQSTTILPGANITPASSNSIHKWPAPQRPIFSADQPRILVIGAGSRGNAYAEAIGKSTNGVVISVAEPKAYKRTQFGERYIWGPCGSGSRSKPAAGEAFVGWREFVTWELDRRERAAAGEDVPVGVDAAFVCVLDELHTEVILGLAPLALHIMCEKPLATNLRDCVTIYKSLLLPNLPGDHKRNKNTAQSRIFSIGHVLRYSPHNILLRRLLLEEKVIGEILSINHTEPVGWWHFTHSYVRGNWRKESTTAPSLLTKSCHDIDLILWMLCSPPPGTTLPAHIPSTVSSMGSLQYFHPTRKPKAAGKATNCLSCPIESSCKYSAKKIYLGSQHQGLRSGNYHWPVDIVVPDIEECLTSGGSAAGEAALTAKLAEDYTSEIAASAIASRTWFGRCVYECDNDVCDDQVVTMSWEQAPLLPLGSVGAEPILAGRGAKTAIFHMVAHTEKICERYSHIYGTDGEIATDSASITVRDFATRTTTVHRPSRARGGHGGGDDGLARQFVLAVDQVKNHSVSVADAQARHIGCSLEEIIRSHAMVFAAEAARRGKVVVDFPAWWRSEVEANLKN